MNNNDGIRSVLNAEVHNYRSIEYYFLINASGFIKNSRFTDLRISLFKGLAETHY